MVNLEEITHVCICGGNAWQPEWVIFDNYEIAAYSLDMKCVNCGCTAIAPTEIDRPDEGLVTV